MLHVFAVVAQCYLFLPCCDDRAEHLHEPHKFFISVADHSRNRYCFLVSIKYHFASCQYISFNFFHFGSLLSKWFWCLFILICECFARLFCVCVCVNCDMYILVDKTAESIEVVCVITGHEEREDLYIYLYYIYDAGAEDCRKLTIVIGSFTEFDEMETCVVKD